MPSNDPLRELGRSVAQLHIKLSRIDGKLVQGGSAAAREAELELLLDLVDAVESAIERRAPARGWFRRARASADDLWRGLAIAVADARERLRNLGIEPAPVEGTFDSSVHHVIEVVPPRAGNEEGTLAATQPARLVATRRRRARRSAHRAGQRPRNGAVSEAKRMNSASRHVSDLRY